MVATAKADVEAIVSAAATAKAGSIISDGSHLGCKWNHELAESNILNSQRTLHTYTR